MTAILNIENVSHSFDNNQVLSKVSFIVNKGDFIGLIGPNGSGKTTLVKLILGLYPLQHGKIKIDGKDLKDFNEWHKISYVPQKATSIHEAFPASVKEVVATGLLPLKKFPRTYTVEDYKNVGNVLHKVGMQKFADRRIGELSGGQQQRVLIARSLIAEPDLIILDEPTTGVDQENQKKFYDLLGGLNKEGISILLISHDIERITNYVTKIASLNKTLEFYGTHHDFCMHPAGDKDHHCLILRRKEHHV